MGVALALPEPPRVRHQAFPPPAPFLRQQLPRQEYGAPPPPPPPPVDNSYAPPPPQGGSYGPPPPQPPMITKNFYVHLPPEDEEDFRAPQVIQPPPPRKHYKLIFIKAPEAPKYTAPVIAPQSQDEHKTLVYVLVKKPDEQPDIQVPNVEPTPPSKPEVYFIKYKHDAPKPEYGPPPATPKPEYGPPPPVVDFGPPQNF